MRKILATSALPYANGSIHLGHLLEYIQTDIWVRYQRLIGNEIYYVCADDTHGTPVMLRAKKEGITPKNLVDEVHKEHTSDFKDFNISFDNFYSTNSRENKTLSEEVFRSLEENNKIIIKEIEQFFDNKKSMFLPDRFIKGTCPKCNAEDQYGDSCESCGATYSPTELIDPKSILSNTEPKTKDTNHYFFNLKDFKDYLIAWTKSHNLQTPIRNKLNEWLNDSLNDWDITRDEPYFGFKIPGENDKYFYVWMDAPIGYIAAFEEYSKKNNKFEGIWDKEEEGEIYHFIGKDISYFHALFWPSILNGAGYRTQLEFFVMDF